ncbi:MAG: glycosyltransferase family 4 protein [Nitrososphaeraceae archaeon]
MKIMIINSLYYPNIAGGAEKSVQIIAENLKKFDMIPVIVSISDEEKIDYINGVKVYYLYHSNIYWSYYSKTKKSILKLFWHFFSLYNFTLIKKVNNIIEKENPDVVHTNNLSEFSVGIWRVFRKKKIPIIHTLRDYSLLCPRTTLFIRGNNCKNKKLVCKLILAFRRRFSTYVDVVVGNSYFILNEHINSGFFKNSQKKVIYNSLETERISAKTRKNNYLDFGFIGLLSYHKGIELLLRVFKEMDIESLYVFGKGITSDYENYLKNKYVSNKISFKGFVKTEEAFKKIDVLVIPSLWHDPLPRVLYEAYSYGVPVIGSDRGGLPEIIDVGKTGFIFNPDFEEQLKDKINIFKNNPEIIEHMSLSCVEKARDFLPEKVVHNYVNVYRNER